MAHTAQTSCFLCGKPADCTDADRGNRKIYRCSNPECGDYVVTNQVMRLVENSTSRKRELMRFVNDRRRDGKMATIAVDIDGQIIAQTINPSEKA